MVDSFVDPQVEGTFTITAESRARVHKYIQERIIAHESTIRYYKRRQNALTVTCRIPPEVLACIFGHVSKDAARAYSDAYFIRWIKILHICSHWREVALSTPSLWSTIKVEYYPTWALEMLQRSKSVPLSVINEGTLSNKTYHVLQKILASHLPRIQDLMLGQSLGSSHWSRYLHTSINIDELKDLLQLMGQHDCVKMERLEMNSAGMAADNAQLQLPDRVITGSASLTHLILEGYGINWLLSPAFGWSLKTFKMSRMPAHFQPESMAQILRFLSHLPLLETLSITGIDTLLPSCDAEEVHLNYLKHVKVACKSLSDITSFIENLTFPKENNITVSITSDDILVSDEPVTTTLQKLTQRMDNVTDGSVLELVLGNTIQCWKSRQTRSAGWQPPSEPPIIELDSMLSSTSALTSVLMLKLNSAVLRSLCLDHIVYLEVMTRCSDWFLLGKLPHIEELKVYSNELAVITALSQTEQSKTHPGLHPAFPALTNLTIDAWSLDDTWNIPPKTVAERLLECVKLRNKAKLPLKRLGIKCCTGVNVYDLSDLEAIIDDVDWDGSGDPNDVSEDLSDDENFGDFFGYDDDIYGDFYGF